MNEKKKIRLSDFIRVSQLNLIFVNPLQKKSNKEEKKKHLHWKKKGFLPKNESYCETMSSPQEEVEKNPEQYIIQEFLSACQELWKKIYIHLW